VPRYHQENIRHLENIKQGKTYTIHQPLLGSLSQDAGMEQDVQLTAGTLQNNKNQDKLDGRNAVA
jgi:hypothetical protein